MGTEVLRSQHCFVERIRAPPASFNRRRTCNYQSSNNNFNNYNNNPFPAANSGRNGRKPATRPEQRKRVERRPSSDDSRIPRSSNRGMVMEKVMILRRGESLDSMIKSEALRKEGDDLVVIGTQRLGPDPEMVPKQIRIVDFKSGSDVYAGSAFAMSPSPDALPLPSFGKKLPSLAAVDDSATRDLRRLLRLE